MPRRTHASQNPPAPGAGTDPIEVIAGDPPVPLTVCRTPARVGQASSVSPRLADRLVTAYRQPGEAVVDLTEDHARTGTATVGTRSASRPRAGRHTRLGRTAPGSGARCTPRSGAALRGRV